MTLPNRVNPQESCSLSTVKRNLSLLHTIYLEAADYSAGPLGHERLKLDNSRDGLHSFARVIHYLLSSSREALENRTNSRESIPVIADQG